MPNFIFEYRDASCLKHKSYCYKVIEFEKKSLKGKLRLIGQFTGQFYWALGPSGTMWRENATTIFFRGEKRLVRFLAVILNSQQKKHSLNSRGWPLKFRVYEAKIINLRKIRFFA